MPSFNLEKLRRLVEERGSAGANLRDGSEALRDARADMKRFHDILINDAGSADAQDALRDRMKLSAEQLVSMRKEEILSCQVSRKGEMRSFEINVNISTFHKFIHARDHVKRLERVVEERQSHFARYAIVSGLLAAVGDWGFNVNEMGL